ncbi:MAG: maleylpyruvate isomerase family mycothiol-dependent enzyme [Acidobacteria bacterium]|nr:maleylpyruvate isomerase family mycothiol-dependent enzyme [Acidobacteriota bacterium]
MSLTPMPPTDTRALFRPVATELVTLLRGMAPADFEKPTIAGTWVVRDVVAHIVDFSMRRLSFHRDALAPPPPKRPITSEREFVDFINGINADWVDASRRLSTRLLTDLVEKATIELADFFEALPMDAPALFGVSWAGEQTSDGWFDIGREFTELWHHQQQIRLAVGAAPLENARFLHAVLEIALRGLPHAYRDVAATDGDTVALDVTGPARGQWTLVRDPGRWAIQAGAPEAPTTRVRMSDDAAWRLLFNALKGDAARAAVQIDGRADLAEPLLAARSVVV